MSGETPDVVGELLEVSDLESDLDEPAPEGGHGPLAVRLWDPSTQLRFRAKRGAVPPRPDGSPNRAPVAPQGAP